MRADLLYQRNSQKLVEKIRSSLKCQIYNEMEMTFSISDTEATGFIFVRKVTSVFCVTKVKHVGIKNTNMR